MSGCGCAQPCECTGQPVDETEPVPVDGKVCAPAPCTDDPGSTASDPFPRLTPGQARVSVANRTARQIDRARQQLVKQGFRPYNVDLVFTKWTGATRGDGTEQEYKRIALTPSPKVIDLSAVTLGPVATGVMPMGSIRLDKVSACYTSDILEGRLDPAHAAGTPEPFGFYYEVYEDGRNGTAERMKFRLTAKNKKPFGWSLLLERISQDAARDGTPAGASS